MTSFEITISAVPENPLTREELLNVSERLAALLESMDVPCVIEGRTFCEGHFFRRILLGPYAVKSV